MSLQIINQILPHILHLDLEGLNLLVEFLPQFILRLLEVRTFMGAPSKLKQILSTKSQINFPSDLIDISVDILNLLIILCHIVLVLLQVVISLQF